MSQNGTVCQNALGERGVLPLCSRVEARECPGNNTAEYKTGYEGYWDEAKAPCRDDERITTQPAVLQDIGLRGLLQPNPDNLNQWYRFLFGDRTVDVPDDYYSDEIRL
jgi:hypothetical protein